MSGKEIEESQGRLARLRRLLVPDELDLSLRFRDREFDERFARSWTTATLQVNRIWAAVGVATYLVMTLVTYANVGPETADLFDLRFAIGLPLAAASLAYLFLDGRNQALSVLLYLLSTTAIFQFSLWQLSLGAAEDSILFLGELVMILAFAQHYNRVLFRWNLGFTLGNGAVAAYAIATMERGAMDAGAPLLLALGAIALIGLFSSYAREIHIRRNYAAIQRLRAEKQQIETLARESSQASEAKSRFLAVISHELRTPLNAVIGYAEMIRSGMAARLGPGKVDEYLGYIHESGRNQLNLVNTLLEITRNELDDVSVRAETVDVDERLQQVVAQVMPQAMDLNCRVALAVAPGLPALHCNPDQLRQMVANLINNAMKFSKQAGHIDVRATQRADGGIRIEVEDQGVGIAPDRLADVVRPFTQIVQPDRVNDGLGIGLPLTKTLIEAHGGQLSIDSREGEGTRVVLDFPVERSILPPSAQAVDPVF